MLKDLQTSLKSIKYGTPQAYDRPGGGNSNEPYIKTEIPEGRGGVSKDFILRNGILAVSRAAKDSSRLTKLLFDIKSPKGLTFITKQNLLSRTSVKTIASKGPAYGGILGNINQGIYLPTSTIAQSLVTGIGGHLNHFGLDPSGLSSLSITKYEDVFNGNAPALLGFTGNASPIRNFFNDKIVLNAPTPSNNLLEGLANSAGNLAGQAFGENFGEGVKNVVRNAFKLDDPVFIQYPGGPGSALGIGQTRIKFASNRVYGGGNYERLFKNSRGRYPGIFAYNARQFLDAESVVTNPSIPQDFRKNLDLSDGVSATAILSLSPNYKTNNYHKRTYAGDPGLRNNINNQKNVLNYGVDATTLDALDKITAQPIYEDSNPSTSLATNDLVKFRFAVINNDKTNGDASYIHFRAFIDSFSDSYGANWNPVNYAGRGDTLYNYTGFTRTINLSFTVAAQSKAELIPMYKKLNYLASSLAPDYSTSGFMRGNIVRFTLGGYIYEQPGIITSLNYTIPTDGTWEIGIDSLGKNDPSVKELPHRIQVSSLSFIPIHDFLVEKANDRVNPRARYISLANGKGDDFSNYPDLYQPYLSE